MTAGCAIPAADCRWLSICLPGPPPELQSRPPRPRRERRPCFWPRQRQRRPRRRPRRPCFWPGSGHRARWRRGLRASKRLDAPSPQLLPPRRLSLRLRSLGLLSLRFSPWSFPRRVPRRVHGGRCFSRGAPGAALRRRGTPTRAPRQPGDGARGRAGRGGRRRALWRRHRPSESGGPFRAGRGPCRARSPTRPCPRRPGPTSTARRR
mmetsp:Transcript_41763/g.94312  ORF Transcript_41763/g.94312 Transcript_41763/m.94312 type:complete len:207 (+) Transcript_41763:1065-1685(+)